MVWYHIQPYCQYNNKAVNVSEQNWASMWHYGEEVQCLMQYAEISAVYTTKGWGYYNSSMVQNSHWDKYEYKL